MKHPQKVQCALSNTHRRQARAVSPPCANGMTSSRQWEDRMGHWQRGKVGKAHQVLPMGKWAEYGNRQGAGLLSDQNRLRQSPSAAVTLGTCHALEQRASGGKGVEQTTLRRGACRCSCWWPVARGTESDESNHKRVVHAAAAVWQGLPRDPSFPLQCHCCARSS